MMTIETVFWTQIGSILGVIGVLYGLFRLLVEQKDATIQTQRENIALLKEQLAAAKTQSPDSVAQNLATRIRRLEEELTRLNQDKSATAEQVKAKASALNQARLQAEEMNRKLGYAREFLKDFSCPYCGASLVQRANELESADDQGGEFGMGHVHATYECGYEIVNGEIRGQCSAFSTNPVA
jgi:rubrerythrin